jgi:ferredoxin
MAKITINFKKCLGCGTCTYIAPKAFKLGKGGKAEVKVGADPSSKEVKEAVSSCPVGAIRISN